MNKMKKILADAWRQITYKPLLLTALVAFGVFAVPAGVRADITEGAGPTSTVETGSESDAASRSQRLFQTFRTFAGWILLVALVLAGLMAAFGQYKAAWGVAIAAIVIYGGTWIIGMIRESINSSSGGS